jgi:FolB domain-containing protein
MTNDRIHIRGMEIDCIIGTQPKERVAKQRVSVSLVLEYDLAPAGKSDRIEDTVDYKVLKDRIVAEITKSDFFLIERMAAHIADLCMEGGDMPSVTVTVDKPGALTGAKSVAVEIRRRRDA